MKYTTFPSKYDRFPKIHISDESSVVKGPIDIANTLIKTGSSIFVFECYPGVRYTDLIPIFDEMNATNRLLVDDYALDNDSINALFQTYLTEDRVFGKMNNLNILDVYPESIKHVIKNQVKDNEVTVIYGFGASAIFPDATLVYLDLSRWEIQLRYRSHEMSNWKMRDYDLDILRKYKRGYFIEWRIADAIKDHVYTSIDFYLDSNSDTLKMVRGQEIREAIHQASTQPFRLVPYFDMGIWGGQWMKEVCNLDPAMPNYAWCFDGVPEENSVYFEFGNEVIESPSINIVLFEPENLLGSKITTKYGREFPIRFDFLDTVEGGNLSLQVHPVSSYIKEQFNMEYTQDESYYILYAEEDATVYLGLKEGIDKSEMLQDLRIAQTGEKPFPAEQYINQFPAKKHDHFLIPAGTIHCSGANTMVLEISATPYIFTFKLWDWGRVGLDGIPRPVHLDHGEQVIDWTRTTTWVENHLVNAVTTLHEDQRLLVEKTGLHELEPIETLRYTIAEEVTIDTTNSVHVLNLVDGEEAIIESPSGSFSPYIIHYAETTIVPASILSYRIRPYGNSIGKSIKVIRAAIR